MRNNICALQEKRLVDSLRPPKVKGEVIEKRGIDSSGDRPERKIVVAKFKNRIIETTLVDSQFERTEIGGCIWFSPPIPDRDPYNGHLFVRLIVGPIAGAPAIGAITSHFHGRTATLLSLAATGWIRVIVWAGIGDREQGDRE